MHLYVGVGVAAAAAAAKPVIGSFDTMTGKEPVRILVV
jgi:hypothetical protein